MNSVTFVLCLLVLGAHSLLVFGDEGISFSLPSECNFDGHTLKAGEKHTTGNCVEYTCHGGAYSTVTCTQMVSLKGCKETQGDLSKPYPACCTQYEDC